MNDTPNKPQETETPNVNKVSPSQKKKEREKPELIKEPITFALLIQQLLKSPLNVVYSMQRSSKLPWLSLALFTLVAFALFGFILGLFSGGHQLWAAPVKVAGGILFASLICLPSLYIFSNLCGIEAKVKTIIGLQACFTCITALLLLGFLPVLWLFSASSSSLAFFGFLTLGMWIVCLFIGLKMLKKASIYLGASKFGFMEIWIIIFITVTLQMPTTLRPIIGEYDEKHFINVKEKKFFLEHWGEALVPEGYDSDQGRY